MVTAGVEVTSIVSLSSVPATNSPAASRPRIVSTNVVAVGLLTSASNRTTAGLLVRPAAAVRVMPRPRLGTRTMSAWPPPLEKNCRTACDSGLCRCRPPNCRSYSPNPPIGVGVSSGPRGVHPTKAVIDVAPPTMVREPLGTSRM